MNRSDRAKLKKIKDLKEFSASSFGNQRVSLAKKQLLRQSMTNQEIIDLRLLNKTLRSLMSGENSPEMIAETESLKAFIKKYDQ